MSTTPISLLRIGNGYDAHRLVSGRPLILGGVTIAYDRGLLGHSDADVLTHAVMDALLGAAALPDIGVQFPDTDPTWKDISSLTLLTRVRKLLRDAGYIAVNIDAVITAQTPKLSPYLPEMRANLARALALPSDQVGIKATTEEGMGFTGRGEGISALAVCLIQRDDNHVCC